MQIPDREPTLANSYHYESDIFEDIEILLKLPNGTEQKLNVKIGETVQQLKRYVDTDHSIPYEESVLFLNGKAMLDPLSLNDFPTIVKSKSATIDVKVFLVYKIP